MFGLTDANSYNEVLTIPAPTTQPPGDLVVSIKSKLRAAQLAGVTFVAAKIRVADLERDLRELEEGADAARRSSLESQLTEARTALSTARGALNTATATASDAIDQPGIVVFRWATESKSAFSLAALFGFQSREDVSSSGYTIAAGWRESTLVVGPDIRDLRLAEGESWDWWVLLGGWFPWFGRSTPDKYRQVTTRAIQTRAIAYLQDVSIAKSLEVNLDAAIDDLGSAAKALEAADRIEIEFALAQVQSLTTEGVFGNAGRTVVSDVLQREIDQAEGETLRATAASFYGDDEERGWLTLLSVEVDLPDLQQMFKVKDKGER